MSQPWVDVFEAARPKLLGLGYRMLGTIADAEDVVQEAFLRWHAADHDAIDKPEAWLTTVTSRIALDRLAKLVQEWLQLKGMSEDAAKTLLASDYAGNVDKPAGQSAHKQKSAAAAPERQVRHLAA